MLILGQNHQKILLVLLELRHYSYMTPQINNVSFVLKNEMIRKGYFEIFY